jgi:uncharacterized secreted protein with C-terminal beta-propeller domain
MAVKYLPWVIVITSLSWGCTKGTLREKIFGKSEPSSEEYGTPFAVQNVMRLSALPPNVNLGIRDYANCEEISADLSRTLDSMNAQNKALIAKSIQDQLNWMRRPQTHQSETAQADSASSGSETMTNVQEQGVDEADSFRIGQNLIFARKTDGIAVVDRQTLAYVGHIPLLSRTQVQLYTQDQQFILIQMVPKQDPMQMSLSSPISTTDSSRYYADDQMSTDIRIYDTQPGSMPTLKKNWVWEGKYLDSRLIQNQLVLVMNDSLTGVPASFAWDEFSEESWFSDPEAFEIFSRMKSYYSKQSLSPIQNESISGVPCTAISQRKVADFDLSFTKILSLDITKNEAQAKVIGTIGQGQQIYVTQDSIYLIKNGFNWFSGFGAYSNYGSSEEKVYLRQAMFNPNDGDLKMVAEGEVPGRIKDRWALRGLNAGKNLVITTSTGLLWNSAENVAQNHLFVLQLDESNRILQILSGIQNFGTHEDIRSVRYVGDKVYVVTFKKTDPLFAFDLSDLTQPQLLSGLKIPGFSTYMHPVAEGRMLGLGFDAADMGAYALYQGIQVSLFDISDPREMARIDNHVYGNRGSSSEATSNHHAFFFDAASGLIGIPIVILPKDNQAFFSGTLILAYENDKLVEKGRISHQEWIPGGASSGYGQWWQNQQASQDVNRVYRVDDRLITISPYGLKAFALDNFAYPLVSTVFTVKN